MESDSFTSRQIHHACGRRPNTNRGSCGGAEGGKKRLRDQRKEFSGVLEDIKTI